jgi:hypothetical protein
LNAAASLVIKVGKSLPKFRRCFESPFS